jgi:hypothetical protein
MLRRSQITMSDAELEAFLAEERVVTCATIGPSGSAPDAALVHQGRQGDRRVDLRQVTEGEEPERLPQATLQVEAGKAYQELRGAMFECTSRSCARWQPSR